MRDYPGERAKISPLAMVSIPLGILAWIILGAVYALLPAFNPWSIANPLGFLILGVAAAWTHARVFRIGKIRIPPLVWVLGFFATLLFTLATFEAIRQYHGAPSGPIEFHKDRLDSGITLFGSSGTLRGWLLGIVWVLGVFSIFILTTGAAIAEIEHPFCERCNAWARRKCWQFDLRGPDPQSIQALKKDKTVLALARTRAGGDRLVLLEAAITACKCGSVASLSVNTRKTDSADNIISGVPLSRRDLDQIFQWAESFPGEAPPRPQLDVVEIQADIDQIEPFILPEKPEGEYTSTFRWLSGMLDAQADNEFTKPLRKHLTKGDWRAARDALAAQRHPSDRSFVADACADWDETPRWIDAWLEAEPDSPEAFLVRGISGVHHAWALRGADWTPKNVHQFWSRLREADEDLQTAAELSPRDPTPWAWRIFCSKGLEMGLGHHRELFDEAIARSPGHRAAHSFYLDAIKPKWGGTHAMVETFMEETLHRARPGSHMLVVVPEAIAELAEFDPVELEDVSKDEMATYYVRPDVRDKLRRANELLFHSDRFQINMDTARTRAWFAYALWKTGQLEEAAHHLRIIGPKTPWSPFPPAIIRFSRNSLKKARKDCGVR